METLKFLLFVPVALLIDGLMWLFRLGPWDPERKRQRSSSFSPVPPVRRRTSDSYAEVIED